MTWRHPSITYGAVEPESTSPPPGRRRVAGWAATIIGVGLAASALSLALGGGGLALKAAAALVLELIRWLMRNPPLDSQLFIERWSPLHGCEPDQNLLTLPLPGQQQAARAHSATAASSILS